MEAPPPEETLLVTENPSYEGLTHRRAFFATQDGLLVIADFATGSAAGTVGVHFNLCPGEVEFAKDGTLRTLFDDGNNIRIKSTGSVPVKIQQEEGWVSNAYRKKEERPAYAVEMPKKAGDESLDDYRHHARRRYPEGFDRHRPRQGEFRQPVRRRSPCRRQNLSFRI